MVVFEETNYENLNLLMPFYLGTHPLKIRSIGMHVGGFKHHLNGYFVVFLGGLFPGVTSQVCRGGAGAP